MNKKLAQDLLTVFDTPKNVETFQAYLGEEINRAYLRLKSVSDPIEIYRLQGQITSFELLMKVRDTAVSIAKGE